jgi:uncharacterized protein
LFHAGGMLGYVKYGRTIGAAGTTIVLAIAALMLVFSGVRAL